MKKIRPIDIVKKLNVSTSSLRSYEARGIVPPTEQLSSGYRVYTERHVAYFECIVAMSPGIGMEITSTVLKKLQLKELYSALWIIIKAQPVIEMKIPCEKFTGISLIICCLVDYLDVILFTSSFSI